jgi:FKBP-type peptidyl-prolyl cis-trans isomerase SlyD
MAAAALARKGKMGPMKIQKDTVVTLRYKVAEPGGKLIEESREPIVYLHGGYDNTLPKIEAALDGREPGYEVTLQLKPEDAFGTRDESLVRTIPKKEFPPGVKVGGQLEGHTDEGQPHVFHVMKIKGDTVHLDGNHPLAGKELRFVLKVTGVRAASGEEIEHRHVHGAHGHQH